MQLNQNHSLFGRYMLSTTFWDPAFTNSPENILSNGGPAGSGGRDNYSHSFVVGDTVVLSNTVVNNIRVSVNKTKVQRWHADMFSPQEVGMKIYSYLPKYVTMGVTGAFAINTATESFAFYQPSTYSLSDDLTIVRGDHQFGIGGAVALSDWKTETNVRSMGSISFNGSVTGLPLGDFLLGRMFEYRQATPFRQNITQNYVALYAQDTWRVSPKVDDELRPSLGTLVSAEQRGRRLSPTPSTRAGSRRANGARCSRRRPLDSTTPGDEGFPGTTGMKTVWTNLAPRVGISWGSGEVMAARRSAPAMASRATS